MAMNEGILKTLCEVLSAFPDCELTVLPFGEDVPSGRSLWLVPDGEEQATEYVAGVREMRLRFLLKLRHRAITAEERLASVSLLERVAEHGRDTAELPMRISIRGAAKYEGGHDGAYGVFSLPILVGYTTSAGADDVLHYVSFGGGRMRLGGGVMEFGESRRAELYRRRFIHEGTETVGAVNEGVSFELRFDPAYPACPLIPIRDGAASAEVLRSYPTGEAELYSCILGEYAERDGICSGTLSSVGKVRRGTFDRKTGVFTEGGALE